MFPDGLPSDLRIARLTADETLPLRQHVLHPSKPIDDVKLTEDADGDHFGAFVTGQESPVAVLSLFFQRIPLAVPIDGDVEGNNPDTTCDNSVRLRKFACDPLYQGKGIGTHLLMYALSIVRSEKGVTQVWCDARVMTKGWYENRGLEAFGETFFKGTVEHIRMKVLIQKVVGSP